MKHKYDAYMKSKEVEQKVEPVVEEPVVQEPEQEEVDIAEEIKPDVTPVSYNDDELSNTIFNQNPVTSATTDEDTTTDLNPTVFDITSSSQTVPEISLSLIVILNDGE